MRNRAHRSADGGSDEEAGTEDAAGVARSVAGRRGDDFQNGEQDHRLEREIAAENPFHVIVADAQDFGHEPSHQADGESAHGRLKPTGPFGQPPEPGADGEQQFDEDHRAESADQAEDGIDSELHGIDQMVGRDVEERLVTQDQVEEHPGSRGTDHHRSEHGSMQVAEDFFERKENRGDGRIEGRGQRGRAPHGHQVADGRSAQSEAASQHGGDSRRRSGRRVLRVPARCRWRARWNNRGIFR